MFVGFVDGDGYLHVGSSGIGKTIKLSIYLEIALELAELPLLQYFQSVLKIGRIETYPDKNKCRYIIPRIQLQDILFPLLKYHNIYFQTNNRRAQFNKIMYILLNNISRHTYNSQPLEFPDYYPLPTLAKDYLNLPFFNNWLVGFTIAEGSFFILNRNLYPQANFKQAQVPHINLFEAFRLLFNTRVPVHTDSYGNFYLTLSSKKDIQSVINFFSFSNNHPLMGLKAIKYSKWITWLKTSPTYNKLKFPNDI